MSEHPGEPNLSRRGSTRSATVRTYLVERRVGDAHSGDRALVPRHDHLGELVFEWNALRSVGQFVVGHPSHVDRTELLDIEGRQVVLHSRPQLRRRLSGVT